MKTHLLFFSLLIIVATSHGQTIFLKFGPSFSRLTWSTTKYVGEHIEKGIIGFNVIAGVNYLNFKYFNLTSGIGIIRKGGAEYYDVGGNDPSYHNDTSKLNFLTINTTFNLKIPILKFIEPYIFAGPRLDYLLSYSENRGFIKGFVDSKKLNKVIYGILFGGGINFNVKRFQLGLVFDYYLNINKLVDYTSIYATEKVSDNTFTINAFIGFKF